MGVHLLRIVRSFADAVELNFVSGNSMDESSNRLWVVHISNDPSIAERARREGFICIGWTKVGDLTEIDSRDKMKAALRRAYPGIAEGTVRSSHGQLFRFAHEMRPGDYVVYPIKNSRDLLIGTMSGPYRWAANDAELVAADYCNVRPVKWLKTVPRISFSDAALHSFGSFSSISTSDEYLEEVVAVLKSDPPRKEPSTSQPARSPATSPDGDLAVQDRGAAGIVEIRSKTRADGPVDRTAVSLAERAIEETKDFLLRSWSRTAQEFEEVVAAVFRAMGYTANTQRGTHDLGVDVVAHPDPLGVTPPLIKIQCKSGTNTVGAPTVKQLRGLLNDREKGILVALGGFSNDARHVQQNDGDLLLIDGDRFVEIFLQHYESLEPEWRNRFPLKRVYVAV